MNISCYVADVLFLCPVNRVRSEFGTTSMRMGLPTTSTAMFKSTFGLTTRVFDTTLFLRAMNHEYDFLRASFDFI